MAIKKLWIEDGCTICSLCESADPDVFQVNGAPSTVKEGADQHFQDPEHVERIKDAAAGCPVEIIKYEEE